MKKYERRHTAFTWCIGAHGWLTVMSYILFLLQYWRELFKWEKQTNLGAREKYFSKEMVILIKLKIHIIGNTINQQRENKDKNRQHQKPKKPWVLPSLVKYREKTIDYGEGIIMNFKWKTKCYKCVSIPLLQEIMFPWTEFISRQNWMWSQ